MRDKRYIIPLLIAAVLVIFGCIYNAMGRGHPTFGSHEAEVDIADLPQDSPMNSDNTSKGGKKLFGILPIPGASKDSELPTNANGDVVIENEAGEQFVYNDAGETIPLEFDGGDAYQDYDFSALEEMAPEKPLEIVWNDESDKKKNNTDKIPEEMKQLEVLYYGAYSGQYPEDGSDEPVQNVAVILVRNTTEEFLEYATLTLDIDGEAAHFIVTGLPAGEAAWVMEADRLTVGQNSNFAYTDCVSSFRSDIVTYTEDIAIQTDNGQLTAINRSNKVLKNVVVYYRVKHSDGNYLGGITYLVSFGDMQPEESVTKVAGHYSEQNSRIIRIDWNDSEQ